MTRRPQRTEGHAAKFALTDSGVVRVLELLRRCDTRDGWGRFHVPLFKRVCQVLRERDGIDLEELDYGSLQDVCASGVEADVEGATVALFLSATWHHLLANPLLPMGPDEFQQRANAILSAEGTKYRLSSGQWLATGVTEAEVLRRILLRGEDDAAGCRQGDQQVEMVVSTVQALLSRPGAVLVDYGAGLGRVLACHRRSARVPFPPESPAPGSPTV